MPNARRSHKSIAEKALDEFSSSLSDVSPEELLDGFEETKQEVFDKYYDEPEFITVRLLRDLKVKVIGDVTGREYFFNGAGSIQSIDKLDIDSINRKNRRKQSCCSGAYASPYFEFL